MKNNSNTVKVLGKNLVFSIHGADKFLSLKGELVIPLEHVVSVSTAQAKWWRSNSSFDFKIGGARIPSVVKDGRFFSKGKLFFYVMHNPENCVTVNLNNERYSAIIFEVVDKEETASMISANMQKSKKAVKKK